VNYSELLQLTKGWGNFVSDRINIWRLPFLIKKISGTIRGKGRGWKVEGKEEDLVRMNPTRS
jgi:hypothetical protein